MLDLNTNVRGSFFRVLGIGITVRINVRYDP